MNETILEAIVKRSRLKNNFLKFRCKQIKELIMLKEISKKQKINKSIINK